MQCRTLLSSGTFFHFEHFFIFVLEDVIFLFKSVSLFHRFRAEGFGLFKDVVVSNLS